MLDKDESAHLFDYKRVLKRYEEEDPMLHYIFPFVTDPEGAKRFRILVVKKLIKRLEDRDGR